MHDRPDDPFLGEDEEEYIIWRVILSGQKVITFGDNLQAGLSASSDEINSVA